MRPPALPDEELAVMLRRGRIMVVHEEPQAAEMVSLALEAMGYEAYACTSPLEAVFALGDGGGHDLLIIDGQTRRAPGVEVVSWARALRPSMPVIVLSRLAETPGKSSRSHAQLPNPYTLVDLEVAVARALSSGFRPH